MAFASFVIPLKSRTLKAFISSDGSQWRYGSSFAGKMPQDSEGTAIADGPTGPTGPTGATGPTGPTGPTGA